MVMDKDDERERRIRVMNLHTVSQSESTHRSHGVALALKVSG